MQKETGLILSASASELDLPAQICRQVNQLQTYGVDDPVLLRLIDRANSNYWGATSDGEELELENQLLFLKMDLIARATSEEHTSDAALKQITGLLLDADDRRKKFSLWRTSMESYVRREAGILTTAAEERINAALDPSLNGQLLRKLFREHPLQRLGPATIRVEVPKLHTHTLELCWEAATPHLSQLITSLTALLQPIAESGSSDVIASAPVDVLSLFVKQACLEERPRDASEIRNLLIGCLFGTSISTLSQTLLMMNLAALPVIAFMALGLVLAKADWGCRERDRLAAQLRMQTSDTVARCRVQTIKYARELSDTFLNRLQNILGCAESEYFLECEKAAAELRTRSAETSHRRNIHVASLRRRAALIELLRVLAQDKTLKSTSYKGGDQ